MDWHLAMETFVHVVDTGSFSGAEADEGARHSVTPV
jgi:hypothetical protein